MRLYTSLCLLAGALLFTGVATAQVACPNGPWAIDPEREDYTPDWENEWDPLVSLEGSTAVAKFRHMEYTAVPVDSVYDNLRYIEWGDGEVTPLVAVDFCVGPGDWASTDYVLWKRWPASEHHHTYAQPGCYNWHVLAVTVTPPEEAGLYPDRAVWEQELCVEVLDSDGDGVEDGDDLCPNTPAETVVDGQGCPLDADGDGILDPDDACPTEAGYEDNAGCPWRIGVLNDAPGPYRLATGSVVAGADACPGIVTVQSELNTTLWAELQVTDTDVGVPEPLVDLQPLPMLLAPGGLLPVQYSTCFDGPNQSLEFTVETTSDSAFALQLIEVLYAATGFSFASTVSDAMVLREVLLAVPDVFLEAVRGFPCAFMGSALSACGYVTTAASHPSEWERFWALVQTKFGEIYFVAELNRLLQVLQPNQVLRGVVNNDLNRMVDRKYQQVARQAVRTGRTVDRVVASIARAQSALAACQRRRRGCSSGRIRQLAAAERALRQEFLQAQQAYRVAQSRYLEVKAIKNVSVPILHSAIQAWSSAGDAFVHARSGTSRGKIHFVSCTYDDTREACE